VVLNVTTCIIKEEGLEMSAEKRIRELISYAEAAGEEEW
jgi:hypothetical protein